MDGILLNELGDRAADCAVGILVISGVQQARSDALRAVKREVESEIRQEHQGATRQELRSLGPMAAYGAYYKRFGSTYHVLAQVESVIKGKAIPDGLPLVEAMFMAELRNMLLTAGHDLDKVRTPLHLRAATGQERYTTLSGRETVTATDDMLLADQEGVISSILKGPDQRTAIDAETLRAIYTVYAPPGIAAQQVQRHLDDIATYVGVFAPAAVIDLKQVYSGQPRGA